MKLEWLTKWIMTKKGAYKNVDLHNFEEHGKRGAIFFSAEVFLAWDNVTIPPFHKHVKFFSETKQFCQTILVLW